MTDEEKQVIETLKTIKRPTLATGFERQTNLLKAIKITLNLIEKQQAEIDKYKEMYAVSIADRVNSAFKQEHENNEDLEMLYKGCQIELEEKDKYINKLENKLMYALSPTTHELALNTQEQFKTIIRENLEEDIYIIKRALKEFWEGIWKN